MAYFIVIGTNNDVKNVVDEIKNSHLQHNVITSGCILSKGQDLYYHWDVFNESGDKVSGNDGTIALRDALTNQISHFKTLIPNNAFPNVFIISRCFDDEECKILQMVCKELREIGGATLCVPQVDIVLLGYDINKSSDVTIRPHWRILKSLQGIDVVCGFPTNILYMNNMDYNGTATDVAPRLLARFLCHWSKIMSSGVCNPKIAVHSNVYAIGMSEYQYDFCDLNDFFKLSAEEILLNRKLNATPSSDTQELIDQNYYKKLDLGLYWIDGLCEIKSLWNSYCTTEWNPELTLSSNSYSVSRHELELASYLNSFLKLYIAQEHREIELLNEEITHKELEIANLSTNVAVEVTTATTNPVTIAETSRIITLNSEIEECKEKIAIHENNIRNNTFIDADDFCDRYGRTPTVTEEDESLYSENFAKVKQLVDYVKSDVAVNAMRTAIERATAEDELPEYPNKVVNNIGCVKDRNIEASNTTISNDSPIESKSEVLNNEEFERRPGCLMWMKSLFSKKNVKLPDLEPVEDETFSILELLSPETKEELITYLNKVIVAIKKADDVRCWWNNLCKEIENSQRRLNECRMLMDGERNQNGDYIKDKEGYRPPMHRKSVSLIDMDLVRVFRDSNQYYRTNIDKFLSRWFDKQSEGEGRMSMFELIKHQVLDPLVGRFHTLRWDGSNPFITENFADKIMSQYISHNIKESKPFVEYVRIQEMCLESNLNIAFYSNNTNIPREASEFRQKYNIESNSIVPVYLNDFVNSLCVVQVLDVPNHIDAIKDFKPKRETELSKFNIDIVDETIKIVGNASGLKEKTKAIYDWMCENISYDTTKQIYDAETCWKSHRGVCQAYSELFCYMAESVGLTVDIIKGITKNSDNVVSAEKHAWVFVYTNAYDGILIDPTWGAGSVSEGKFIKNTNSSIWFDISPYWMIFSHLPDNEIWTKLDIRITDEEFKKLPYMFPNQDIDGKDLLFDTLSSI